MSVHVEQRMQERERSGEDPLIDGDHRWIAMELDSYQFFAIYKNLSQSALRQEGPAFFNDQIKTFLFKILIKFRKENGIRYSASNFGPRVTHGWTRFIAPV